MNLAVSSCVSAFVDRFDYGLVLRLAERWPLSPLGRNGGGTARRWRYHDDVSGLGVAASISRSAAIATVCASSM